MLKEMLLQNLGVLLTALATGFGGWFFGRKKAAADVDAARINNAMETLEYYKNIADDLGKRLEVAIERWNESEKQLRNALDVIQELEQKVEALTNELRKYKQLNGKSK